MDGKALLALFDMAHYLGIDVETLADGDYLLCSFGSDVDFHAVTHVKHLIHLSPVCSRAVVDGLEERGHGKHIVLDHLAVVIYEVQHLGLRATGTVYHTMDFASTFVEHLLDDGRIGTCGRHLPPRR